MRRRYTVTAEEMPRVITDAITWDPDVESPTYQNILTVPNPPVIEITRNADRNKIRNAYRVKGSGN